MYAISADISGCVALEQFLAVALEPDDQRDHSELRLLHRRILGRVAGGADAAGACQRATSP